MTIEISPARISKTRDIPVEVFVIAIMVVAAAVNALHLAL
jgi:hypothetical protein